VEVINLSSKGAMITSEIAPPIGRALRIDFGGGSNLDCVVRWRRDDRIGVELVSETKVSGSEAFKREILSRHGSRDAGRDAGETISPEPNAHTREPRLMLMWRGVLYQGYETQDVHVRNISSRGAMLKAEAQIDVGMAVRLSLVELGILTGEVRWSRGGHIGIRFAETLDVRCLGTRQCSARNEADRFVKPNYLKTEKEPDSPWAARWQKLSQKDL
jgi:hypothetical protein